MRFIKTADATTGTQAVLDWLSQELTSGKKVLWLLSGGSAIASEVQILQSLKQKDLTANLTVMLMDERYGPVGHADSNWQQLTEAGADFNAIHTIPVLSESLADLQETAVAYGKIYAEALSSAHSVVGLFGMGGDGHTAGLLPNSPATQETKDVAVGFEWADFKRITLTRIALLKADVGFGLVYGESKLEALTRLQTNTEPFAELPAKLLWELPEAYVYNDQIGETQ